MWTYEDGVPEPKFGGDAIFNVDVTVDTDVFPMILEFGIVRDSQEEPPEDYTGQMYYSCDGYTCTGTLNDLATIIGDAVLAEYPDFSAFEYELYKVYVKALNPGKSNGNKRQNYELTPINVCD